MSNLIIVNEKYAISSDSLQWMVCKKEKPTKKSKNSDKESSGWAAFAYYATLEATVTALGNLMLRTSNCSSVASLKARRAEIIKTLTSISDIDIIALRGVRDEQ